MKQLNIVVFIFLFVSISASCRTMEVSNDEGNALPVSFEKPVPVTIDKPTPVTFDRPIQVTFDNPPTQVVVINKKPFEKYLECNVTFPTINDWMPIGPYPEDRVIEYIVLDGGNHNIGFKDGDEHEILIPFHPNFDHSSVFVFEGKLLIPAGKKVQFLIGNKAKMYVFGRIEQ